MMKRKNVWETRVNAWVLLVGAMVVYAAIRWMGQIWEVWTGREVLIGVAAGVYLAITVQAALFLYWVLYAWNDPQEVERNKSPREYVRPKYSFTAIVPVRHEEKVIGETIRAIAQIEYPEDKKEVLVAVRGDDWATIRAAEREMALIGRENIRLVVVNDEPINKPNQLNWGLKQAKGEVVAIFDAEDQPHRDIYNIVNTVMTQRGADVVQSGVQLINYGSRWFSALNVLEYYFWFKSALHFFTRWGVVPLGGNTVFFKRRWLNKVGGWDEACLTEDADIGIRLSVRGAKLAVVYDERHTTREETPGDVSEFIRQRSRWNLGFLQILAKGEWLRFKNWRLKMLAAYLLLLPQIVSGLFVAAMILKWVTEVQSAPVWLALWSWVPMGWLVVQFAVVCVGWYMFCRDYKVPFSVKMVGKLFITYLPYGALLLTGAIRALWRYIAGNRGWEKTGHLNLHRQGEWARMFIERI